jgi:hypothetical protein
MKIPNRQKVSKEERNDKVNSHVGIREGNGTEVEVVGWTSVL